MVLIAEDDLAALEETISLLRDPAAQAEQAVEDGDVCTVDEVRARIAARRRDA